LIPANFKMADRFPSIEDFDPSGEHETSILTSDDR
jgi:hypothetical protein